MAPSWECDVCTDEFKDYTSINIERSHVCVGCVRKMFDKAIEFEHEYPPRWVGEVHPTQFSHIFSADFLERYKSREVEYKTPPAKRIYCQHSLIKIGTDGKVVTEPCGNFLGTRQKPIKAANILSLGRCTDCSHMTCMVCDEFHSDATAIFKHECTGKSHANEQRARAFVGLKRGKDWQQCPNRSCARRVELSEACNHMSCPCGTGFCFICGKEADGEDDHWTRRNGCPRYNQPDDENAEYDDGSEYDEDGEGIENARRTLEGDPVEEIRGLFENDTNEGVPAETVVVALPPPPPPPAALLRTVTAPVSLFQIPEVPAASMPHPAPRGVETLVRRALRRASYGDIAQSTSTFARPGDIITNSQTTPFEIPAEDSAVEDTAIQYRAVEGRAAVQSTSASVSSTEEGALSTLSIVRPYERTNEPVSGAMSASQPAFADQVLAEVRRARLQRLRELHSTFGRCHGVVMSPPDQGNTVDPEDDAIDAVEQSGSNELVRYDLQVEVEGGIVDVGGLAVTMEEVGDDELIWQIQSHET